MPANEIESIKSIDSKLSIIINLLAYQIVQGKTVAEAAPLLKKWALPQMRLPKFAIAPQML
jgi:hypothetical protein